MTLQTVIDKIEWEGFEYAICDYSDWKEIKDKKFHRLRKAFVTARNELAEYLGVAE